MTEYVIGFLFDGDNMVMVRKNRPDWQKGLLNAVGGHVEAGELPLDTMRREFKEETGADVEDWRYFGNMFGDKFKVHCFFAEGDSSQCKTTTDEEIVVVPKNIKEGVIDNIPWLVEMADSFRKYTSVGAMYFSIEYVN